jgi:hypothetical protein
MRRSGEIFAPMVPGCAGDTLGSEARDDLRRRLSMSRLAVLPNPTVHTGSM